MNRRCRTYVQSFEIHSRFPKSTCNFQKFYSTLQILATILHVISVHTSKFEQREREREMFIPHVQEYYRETEIKFNIIFKLVALNIEFSHDRYFNLRDAKSHKVIGLFSALSIV